jgi:hypothetical protein
MEPARLSMAFVEAYNRRDADALRSMLAPDVTYVRPGPSPVEDLDAIMALYADDWQTYDATIAVRRIIEADDTAVVELTLTSGDGSAEVEAVVIHRWADEHMAEYRLYLDPLPG